MPRTNIAVQQPVALLAGSLAANSADIAMTAADTVNNNMCSIEGNTFLLAQNTHATTAYTVTITTVADALGRTGDITAYQMDAGDIAIFGPFPVAGFQQPTGTDAGKLYFQANNASVKFAAIKIAGSINYR